MGNQTVYIDEEQTIHYNAKMRKENNGPQKTTQKRKYYRAFWYRVGHDYMYINTNCILTHKPHTIQTGVKAKHTNKKHRFTRKSQHRTKHVKGYNWTKWTHLTKLKPRGVLRYHERVRNVCFISDTRRAKYGNVTMSKEIYFWYSRTQKFRYG